MCVCRSLNSHTSVFQPGFAAGRGLFFLSDLMDVGGSGGTAPLMEATGSAGVLINL